MDQEQCRTVLARLYPASASKYHGHKALGLLAISQRTVRSSATVSIPCRRQASDSSRYADDENQAVLRFSRDCLEGFEAFKACQTRRAREPDPHSKKRARASIVALTTAVMGTQIQRDRSSMLVRNAFFSLMNRPSVKALENAC